jgi:hypothetical protein
MVCFRHDSQAVVVVVMVEIRMNEQRFNSAGAALGYCSGAAATRQPEERVTNG